MAQMYDHNYDPKKDIAFPFFYLGTQEDPRATKDNGGVPVFADVEMVRIKIPGSRDEVDRPVEPHDKTRWPSIYEQFKKGLAQKFDGVPLSEFATATASERATLSQMGCQTVEQVAGLADNLSTKIGLQSIKRKAVAFLELREKVGETGKLVNTIEELKKRIEELESGKNTDPVVSTGDASDGVQPAVNISEQPKPRRKKTGTDS